VGETISKVLYPNDKTENGRSWRLVQQYFFVTCSLRDIIRRHRKQPANSWDNFADKVAIQLNDTHPAIAIVSCCASWSTKTVCRGSSLDPRSAG